MSFFNNIVDTVKSTVSHIIHAPAPPPPPPPPPPQSTEQIQARATSATSNPAQRELLVQGYTQAQKEGDGALQQQTDELATLYHDREVLHLSRTLAAGDAAPPGWSKATDGQLAQYGLNPADMHPETQTTQNTGFNADLFIPDPAVYGPNATPVMVFEGTNFSDTRDVNADVAQAMGSPEEYYNRAMTLATTANEHSGGNIVFSGHSLGGGLATAAAQVTGAPAIVSNPAGVHADTTERFLGERGLAAPANADARITSYIVDGEVLTNLQSATSNLSGNNADGLATDLNLAVGMYNHITGNALPTDLTGEKVRNLPDAAGRVVTFDATNADGSARPEIVSLGQIMSNLDRAASLLSLPGRDAERAGGVLGWLGDRVDNVTNVVGSAAGWIDRNVPGPTGAIIGKLGSGYENLGDVVDHLGEIARDTGRSINDLNHDIAVGISAANQARKVEVRDSLTEMVARHDFKVFDPSIGSFIADHEQALKDQLG